MVDNVKNLYDIAWERAANEDTREDYWKEQAQLIDWYKFPSTILDKSAANKGFWRWFPDSLMNICYNCVDRHQDLGNRPALHWYSAMVKQEKTYSWIELLENVSKLAWVLQHVFQVHPGDRVLIYCPQIPEGVFSMLAAARIGAVHSVVFGGFAAKELASRIIDAKPKVVISASCGLEPNKVINYKEILDEALIIAEKCMMNGENSTSSNTNTISNSCSSFSVQNQSAKPNSDRDNQNSTSDEDFNSNSSSKSWNNNQMSNQQQDHSSQQQQQNHQHSKIKTLIVQREVFKSKKMSPGRDYNYFEEMERAGDQSADCVPLPSTHYLYVLYTSGSTGQPKGIVRDQGGSAVAAAWTMKHILNIKKGDVYFCSSDIGWVVGHAFIVYGPLLAGATTVLYEGKPTGTPDAGAFWRIVEKYQVTGIYTAPTALRAIRREDPNAQLIKNFNIKTLQCVAVAGERCDVPTYEWIQNGLKGVFINDNYWQTETGQVVSCNYSNLHTFKPKPGSAIKPTPGFVVHILDNDNQIITQPNVLGRICCLLPMPPSFMVTLYNNDEAYSKKYLEESPGYYQTGDCGYFDEQGYLNIMTRIDDIINTAGHRLSTAQMEEVLLGHPEIVEAAVVAKIDTLKGEIPVGIVVVKHGHDPDPKQLEKDCIQMVRKNIGPVASFQHCLIVEKLPKTKSGKILRYCLKMLLNGLQITKIPDTIEDSTILSKIEFVIKNNKIVTSLLDFGDVNIDQENIANIIQNKKDIQNE